MLMFNSKSTSIRRLLLGLSVFAAISFSLSCNPELKDSGLSAHVNPFIGTGGHGHTYPGASMPFGMVQLSPDTRLEGWDGCSGYHNSDSIIYGFSHTHLSGTGVSDYGDVLFMPMIGESSFDNGYNSGPDGGYASRFNKNTEYASPGYYAVQLTDYDINVELTVTERAGMHRYTFPAGRKAQVIIDLEHRDKLADASIMVSEKYPNEVEGFRISQAWATEQHIYFVAKFSHQVQEVSIHKLDSLDTKMHLSFDLKDAGQLLVKVGISAVSIEGARKNLNAEIPDWDFDQVKENAQAAWNDQLKKIEIETGNEEYKEIFYTAMYHSMLNPNLFTDVDGQYRGMDLQVHQARNHKRYTVFSLWDTFRATHPLFTIIEKDRTNDFIKSFLGQYREGGSLPIWELAGNYTGCMIGYHAIPVIVDAYMKGIRDYDANKALEAMLHSARQSHLGLASYKKFGCVQAGEEAESVSKTLEYAYDDWCIAIMAKELGRNDIYEEFIQRAQFYKNVFDPNTGFMRARINGTWFSPFDPSEVNFNYTEANSWQYSLFAPHDMSGLITLMGGDEKLEHYLDNLFNAKPQTTGRHQVDITGLIGQYAHGNEPSHHMAYLYNYIGRPWKTQERVHQILTTLYSNQPDGLSGNEDCGQMSSWYVLSAMGFYPVTPGSDQYVFGTPLFDKTTINLDYDKSFIIIAKRNSAEDIYIQSAELNGEPYNATYITQEAIDAGGELIFQMGSSKNTRWGISPRHHPLSVIPDTYSITPSPFFITDARSFSDSIQVAIASANSQSIIYYTLDGSEPDENASLYLKPFSISESTQIRAIAVNDGVKSFISGTKLGKVDGSISISLDCKYANQYSAGGDNALIDMVKGNANFRTGSWQGYQEDLSAVVDLGRVKTIKSISAGFLQDISSWIWYPSFVEFHASTDGSAYTLIKKIENDFSDEEYGSFIKDVTAETSGIKARYIKVVAKNYGKCPTWHLGSGGQAWIFTDEITIN